MAKPNWGRKRDCQSCGASYYDLNKEPAICPKCAAPAVAPSKTKAAQASVVAKAVVAPPAATIPDTIAVDPAAKTDDDEVEEFDAADGPLIDNDDDDDENDEIFVPAGDEKE